MKKLYAIAFLSVVVLQGHDQKSDQCIKEEQIKALKEIDSFFSFLVDQQNLVTKEQVQKSYDHLSEQIKDGFNAQNDQTKMISYLAKYINALQNDLKAKECHRKIHDSFRFEVEGNFQESVELIDAITGLDECNAYITNLEKAIMQELASDQK
ncbi:MAG: hypothetical protein ACXWL5_02620 [Candidatus Chromulinivorax sp.]